jgi:hypothetical protein
MRSGIFALPLELLRNVTRYLDLDDFCNFVQTNRTLRNALGSESTYKEMVKVKWQEFHQLTSFANRTLQKCIFYAKESQQAEAGQISYRSAFERTFRRRRAYASARPYSALVVGEGSDLLYREGVLSYLREGVVHVLNVHDASDTEVIIDLNLALSVDAKGGQVFKLMHYQDNVLAIFTASSSSSSDGWLAVFNTKPKSIPTKDRCLLYVDIQTGIKQFVRHDRYTMIYGVLMNNNDVEEDIWRFQAFSLVRPGDLKPGDPQRCSHHCPQLGDFSTSDVGSHMLFEIYKESFYVISSQVTVDAEGKDPTSYYGGCRYPLSGPTAGSAEYWRIWRRQQTEGPIHDLWTDFNIQEDETGGGLLICESRREWQDGYSKQKRSFYTEPLDLTTEFAFSPFFQDFKTKREAAIAANSVPPDEEHTIEAMMSEASESMPPARSYGRLSKYCQPEYTGMPTLDSREFSLSNTKFRTSNYNNGAFLDMVVDSRPLATCPNIDKHLRLRVGSRRLASPLAENGLDRRQNTRLSPFDVTEDSDANDEQYNDQGIRLWPPQNAPPELYNLLNPDPKLLKVKAAADERSLVYMTTSSDPRRIAPIILINFDPAIRHGRLQRLDIGPSSGPRNALYDSKGEFERATQPNQRSRRESEHESSGSSKDNGDWCRIQKAAWSIKPTGYWFP